MSDNEKPRRIKGEEAQNLTDSLFRYHDELKKKIDNYLQKNDIELEVVWDATKTPLPNIASFSYDKAKYNIDPKLQEILEKVNQNHSPQ